MKRNPWRPPWAAPITWLDRLKCRIGMHLRIYSIPISGNEPDWGCAICGKESI